MIAVELSQQVALHINKREFLGVSTEHDLTDVNLELLLLLSLFHSVKDNIVYCALTTANNSFLAVFIHIHRLVLHHDLLLQFEVTLSEDQNLALTRYINIVLTAHGAEHLHRLRFTRNACHQPEILR